MKPGTRVRLTPAYVASCANPNQDRYRGVVLEPTPHVLKLGDSFRLVLWDGAIEPYPVLTINLEIEG